MIDLEKALSDQQNLRWLIMPKKPRYPEFYWPNANYGFSSVLKQYAGYPANRPIMAVIPHGVYLNDSRLFAGELEVPLRAVLSFPEYRDALWQSTSDKTVVPSAAPFLYALRIMRESGWTMPAERRGTIVAPQHSTAAVDTDTRWGKLADELVALPDRFQPVTLCLHWQDLERKRDQEFTRRGIRVVCAGHLGDQEFLFRLIHLMSQHRYAASNNVGSHLFYALALGLPYFLLGRRPTTHITRGYEHLRHEFGTGDGAGSERAQALRATFQVPLSDVPDAPTAEQRALAEYYLRADRLKSSEDLLADLEYVRDLHS